jgi:hypothetical protein
VVDRSIDDGANLITGPLSLSLTPSSASNSIASHRFLLQLALIFTDIPSHLFSCLAALAQSKDRPFQYLGTAFRVLKEFFYRIHLAPLHQVTHGMFCFLHHCSLVASVDSPRLHLPFFNLHARGLSGVMSHTILSQAGVMLPLAFSLEHSSIYRLFIIILHTLMTRDHTARNCEPITRLTSLDNGPAG